MSGTIAWSDEVSGVTLPPLDVWFAERDDGETARAHAALNDGHFISIEPAVRTRAIAHLSARPVEQAGLLVGRVFAGKFNGSADTRYIIQITDAIPARDDDATATSVSISPRTWLDVQPYLAVGKLTIGWFHSHPNLGAFFSGTDKKTQRSLFHADYNLGWVVDWVRNEEAWFMGAESRQIFGVEVQALTAIAPPRKQIDAAGALPLDAASSNAVASVTDATGVQKKDQFADPATVKDAPGALKSLGIAVAFFAPIFLGVGYFFTFGHLSYYGVSRDSFVRSNEIYVFRAVDAAYNALVALGETDWNFWKTIGATLVSSMVGWGLLAALTALLLKTENVARWVAILREKLGSKNWKLPLQIGLTLFGTLAIPALILYFLVVLVFAYFIPTALGAYAAKTEVAAFLKAGGCKPTDPSKLHVYPCVEVINEKACAVHVRGLPVAVSEKFIAVFDPVRSVTVTVTLNDNFRLERELRTAVSAAATVPAGTPTTAQSAKDVIPTLTDGEKTLWPNCRIKPQLQAPAANIAPTPSTP